MDNLIVVWLALCWLTLTAGFAWLLEALEHRFQAKRKRPQDCHPSERNDKTYQLQYTTEKGEKAR